MVYIYLISMCHRVSRCVRVGQKSSLNSSVVREPARYARGPGFKSRLRLTVYHLWHLAPHVYNHYEYISWVYASHTSLTLNRIRGRISQRWVICYRVSWWVRQYIGSQKLIGHWSEHWHGKPEALGSSPVETYIFTICDPCTN